MRNASQHAVDDDGTVRVLRQFKGKEDSFLDNERVKAYKVLCA